MNTVENHLGFICLTSATVADSLITIKADKIVAIANDEEMGCVICTVKDAYWVKETASEIIGQLQNINPDMR